jgi:hypothetical protein
MVLFQKKKLGFHTSGIKLRDADCNVPQNILVLPRIMFLTNRKKK